MLRHLLILSAAGLLAGCSGLVPSTLADMGRLDPFTADPGAIAVGIDASDGVAPATGSARLIFTATHSPSGAVRTETMQLIEDRSQDNLIVYALAPRDAEALRAWQRDLVAWRETSDGNSSFAVAVTAQGCRVPGAAEKDDPRISVFIRMAEGEALRPLLRETPALPFFEADATRDLPLCEGFD